MSTETNAWWPEKDGRCGELNPDRTHYCDQPEGHDGEHRGPELPTVTLDEAF